MNMNELYFSSIIVRDFELFVKPVKEIMRIIIVFNGTNAVKTPNSASQKKIATALILRFFKVFNQLK
jgi:hypothetical protein